MSSTSARQPFSRPVQHLPPPGQALISCIMPTYNRREFVPHAIRYFLRQDYTNKELIVIDDGEDPVRDLVPVQEAIRYYRLERKLTLGAKLNLGCELAQGDLIAHWDDDDWYSPRRLQYQEGELQKSHKSLCGINRLLYYDLRHHHALQYVYPQDQRVWLIGSSLFYLKELWLTHRFADINVGMDGLFVWSVPKERIAVSQDPTISVHMIHDRNVSPKKTEGIWWTSHPVGEIEKIMDLDYSLYSSWGVTTAKNALAPADVQNQPSPAKKLLKNIFACLVHEQQDCVADLVSNLRYQDPSSIILLYNGGQQPDLLLPSLARDIPGVFIYPAPKVMQHGYLLGFALQCMEFSLEQFDFDTLTIVDSDQLCLRKGYTEYLTDFFRSRQGPAPGLLSGEPWRVTPSNKTNLVAIQAFKEYDLWQSFVQTFPDGEQKFVHWTFWPSTVFTRDAIFDLVKLFRENGKLQEIMSRTKIWATEEVILPTLVRLLGYEIATNPCSYGYVRYKRSYTLQDIQAAYRQEDAFWIHPIERAYHNPLLEYIRQQCNGYSIKNDVSLSHCVKKCFNE